MVGTAGSAENINKDIKDVLLNAKLMKCEEGKIGPLTCVCPSVPTPKRELKRTPAKCKFNFLLFLLGESAPVISAEGFQFLLLDTKSQVWYFLINYITTMTNRGSNPLNLVQVKVS